MSICGAVNPSDGTTHKGISQGWLWCVAGVVLQPAAAAAQVYVPAVADRHLQARSGRRRRALRSGARDCAHHHALAGVFQPTHPPLCGRLPSAQPPVRPLIPASHISVAGGAHAEHSSIGMSVNPQVRELGILPVCACLVLLTFKICSSHTMVGNTEFCGSTLQGRLCMASNGHAEESVRSWKQSLLGRLGAERLTWLQQGRVPDVAHEGPLAAAVGVGGGRQEGRRGVGLPADLGQSPRHPEHHGRHDRALLLPPYHRVTCRHRPRPLHGARPLCSLCSCRIYHVRSGGLFARQRTTGPSLCGGHLAMV